ncbi:hypothetical protein [Paenibacillus elgii]|uniref:hypothetical protein n=1 Tax=Paenibacillus elgii TaxID=189691 RepID=UPI00203EEA26|nr:hypothetical protein [Paenibacillus elgii]MCM3271157.1 hypothetical protein [Paenibacillus elgii]
MIYEVTTLEEFQRIKKNGGGFIAITDSKLVNTRGNRVHKVSCYTVKEKDFIQKVETNNKTNGEYFFTDDYKETMSKFKNMSECKICLKQKNKLTKSKYLFSVEV